MPSLVSMKVFFYLCSLHTAHCTPHTVSPFIAGSSITESGAAGVIRFGANSAAVFQNYSLHDREAEAGAAAAGRKIEVETTA